MNDQTPPWEDNWRDTLAGYETPLQPTDWAAMDALLDGGTPAPPENSGPENTPGPAPAANAGVLKGLFLTLAVVTVAALGYFLGQRTLPVVTSSVGSPAISVDSIPSGYRFRVQTIRAIDDNGQVVDEWNDTTFFAVAFKFDTVYQKDGLGGQQMSIDTAEIILDIPVRDPALQRKAKPWGRFNQTSLNRLDAKTSVREVPVRLARRFRYDTLYNVNDSGELTSDIAAIDSVEIGGRDFSRLLRNGTSAGGPLPLSDLALVPPLAPATPPLFDETKAEQTIRQQRGNDPRTRVVYPMMSRPPSGFLPYNELFRLRLEKAVREHPVEIVYPPANNGYFPPVKGQY